MRAFRVLFVAGLAAALLGLVPTSASAQTPGPLICSSYKILTILIYTCPGPPGPQGPAGPAGAPGGLAGQELVEVLGPYNETAFEEMEERTVACPPGKVTTGGTARVTSKVVTPAGTVTFLAPRAPASANINPTSVTGAAFVPGVTTEGGLDEVSRLEVEAVCAFPA